MENMMESKLGYNLYENEDWWPQLTLLRENAWEIHLGEMHMVKDFTTVINW